MVINNRKSIFSSNVELAMAYVPIQKFENTYEPQIALKKGTIFPELDKPFQVKIKGGVH